MFVQIIEGRTNDATALRRQGEQWRSDVGPGATGFLGVTAGATSDGRAITIVRFESEPAARANSARPEQDAWWSATQKCYDGDVTFTESSDVQMLMGGGSNEAGFVQVMKSSGVDRAQVERLDEQFEKFADVRPDLLGAVRIWTGPDRCFDVAYFTNEAEARAGEKADVPDELKEMMSEFEGVMQDTEYFDLVDPDLH